jgi:hypothetical protein
MRRCQHKRFRLFLLFLGALLFVTGGAWFADFLRELLILGDDGDDWWNFLPSAWCWVLISLGIWLIGALSVYFFGKDLVTFRPHLDRKSVVQHRVLVLLVSKVKENKDKLKHAMSLCTGDLRRDIETFTTDTQLTRWPWLHMLRAVDPHEKSLRRVVLVGSKDSGENEGSVHDLDDCRKLLYQYLDNGTVSIVNAPDEPNFERIDDMQKTVEQIIEDVKMYEYDEKDVIFDVTGGTKMASIAVALSTLDHPEIDFQYVTQSGDYKPVMYNLVGSLSKLPT